MKPKREPKKEPRLIPFVDNKGHVIHFPENATVADLIQAGVKDIVLMPKDSPLPDGWYRDNA